MIPALSLHNLLFWTIQVAIVVGIGLLLPALFSVRHPRWHLIYCHSLLVLTLVLPFIHLAQRNEAPMNLAVSWENSPAFHKTVHSIQPWLPFVVPLIFVGAGVRLVLFVIGMVRIRQYRRTAIPYEFPKESVLSVCRLAHADLFVGISSREIGPVSMGWLRPTVLLPASFLSLPEEAQHAILSHELSHITRNDWTSTLIEELVGACLWFHPAILWLLARIRVTREQVIDSDVVRQSYAGDAYIDALLAMAAIESGPLVNSVPMFIRSCHLSERLRFLLNERNPSRERVIFSYSAMAIVVVLAVAAALMTFPVAAHSGIVGSAPFVAPSSSNDWQVYAAGDGLSPLRLVERVSPEYADAPRLAHVQGTVVLEGIVGTDGKMTVKRVARHLHPQLDRNAERAVNEWRFAPLNGSVISAPVPLLVEVRYSLPPSSR